jgi:hypothetical protein
MTREEHAAVNQAAIHRLKAQIDADYPPKQFAAVAGGKIVADEADIDRLLVKLAALGIDPMEAMVDRAGEGTLGELHIL